MISVLELRNKDHDFYDHANIELPHLLEDEDDSFESWFEQYSDYDNEEDILNSLYDWIPYCLAQLMSDYGFDMNKFGYFYFKLKRL